MATLKDVAREAGVSTASVSHAINHTKPVSPALRERVLQAAHRLGYTPHPHARTLSTGKSRTLGVLLPDLGNPFFPALLKAICDSANQAGYGTLVVDASDTAEGEREALALLVAQRVDGIVWAPRDTPETVPAIPTVTVDREAVGCDGVTADHTSAGQLLAEHLNANKRTKLAVLHGPTHLPSARARTDGFKHATTGRIHFEAEVPFSHQIPKDVAKAFLESATNLDAVVCANDAVALGVLRLLRGTTLTVPNDIAVVGVDDIAFAELAQPALTTVRQPLAELGTAAVAMLLERIEGFTGPARNQTLPVKLIERESSGTPTTRSAR